MHGIQWHHSDNLSLVVTRNEVQVVGNRNKATVVPCHHGDNSYCKDRRVSWLLLMAPKRVNREKDLLRP